MARVNISMPDELLREAKRAGMNISQLAQGAVAAELTRVAKVRELDAYLAEMESQLGPTTEDERAAARTWAERALRAPVDKRSA